MGTSLECLAQKDAVIQELIDNDLDIESVAV